MPYTEQLDEDSSKHAGKFLPSREFAAPQVPPLHVMTLTKELVEELLCVRISLPPGFCQAAIPVASLDPEYQQLRLHNALSQHQYKPRADAF